VYVIGCGVSDFVPIYSMVLRYFKKMLKDKLAQKVAEHKAKYKATLKECKLAPKWALRNLERISLEFDENLGGLGSMVL
jgi:hypothetical protein